MADKFLHGVEVLEIDAGPRPIQTVRSSVIGIVGTAPDSAAMVLARLEIAAGTNGAVVFTAKPVGVAGNNISVRLVKPSASSAALAITVSGGAIVVSLATSSDGGATTTATQLAAAITANAAASALVTAVAGGTGASVVGAIGTVFLSGGVDEAFPLNKPVMIAGSRLDVAKLGTKGTLPDALDSIFDQVGAVVVVVRVAAGSDDATTTAAVIGGVNAITGNYEGVHAFLGAESALGFVPRILIAPGFTHQRANGANAVVAEMIGVADRLRAVIIQDGTNTTDAAAITASNDFGSSRVYVCDPWVLKLDSVGQTIQAPPSAHVAGLIAKSDNDRGFWWSPSNQAINGIVGTVRPVDFTLGDANARANLLNEQCVATIINQDGYRLWGNRSLSDDPKFAFLSVRRTADMINDSLLRAHLWAVDRNISKTYVEDVVEGVNSYLRSLVGMGAILGGTCWPNADLNTPANIAQGKVFFDFDFTPPYPAEHITFRSQLTNEYLTEIF